MAEETRFLRTDHGQVIEYAFFVNPTKIRLQKRAAGLMMRVTPRKQDFRTQLIRSFHA
jgi:hypothetical protein